MNKTSVLLADQNMDQALEDTIDAPVSIIELLYLKGQAQRIQTIGNNRTKTIGLSFELRTSETAEIIILAPTPLECRSKGWLDQAIETVLRHLSAEGRVYVLAPLRWRRSIRRKLKNRGLIIEITLAHLPSWQSPLFLVPLKRRTAKFAFSNLIHICPLRRRFARLVLHLPIGEKLLSLIFPSVGMIARRFSTKANYSIPGVGSLSVLEASQVIVGFSCHPRGAAILHSVPETDEQSHTVIKTRLKRYGDDDQEANLLCQLGPLARSAGAEVPELLGIHETTGRTVFLQTGIKGRTVAAILSSQSRRLVEILERLTRWLEVWNLSTAAPKPLNSERLNQEILAPAELLASQLQNGNEFLDRLNGLCASVLGQTIPLVAAHNDLTMWNVLLDENRKLGVVDWEAACEQGFPLLDFFYSVTDAVAAMNDYRNRPQAFQACFATTGKYYKPVRNLLSNLQRNLGISDSLTEICFYACWLHHAVNENRRTTPAEPRPFLEIVQWIALYGFQK